jgi:hypothetical protein
MLKVDLDGAEPLVKWFVEELEKTFARHQVKPTPMLLMLGEDVITHYVLVRAAHTAYSEEKTQKTEEDKTKAAGNPPQEAPKGNGNETGGIAGNGKETKRTSPLLKAPARNNGASLDDIIKFREKLRKSIADFIDACAAAGTPVNTGLSELFAAVDAKMTGIMQSAMAYARETAGSTEEVPGAPLIGLRPDMQAIRPETETPTAAAGGIQQTALAENE